MKNLKMFAITLLAFLVMVSGVHAATNPCAGVSDSTDIYATIDNNTGKCYATLKAVMDELGTSGKDYKSATIKLYGTLDSVGEDVAVPSDKNVTLDLNGKNVTVGTTAFKVNAGGSLTVKSSSAAKISSTGVANLFRVDGGKLTIDGKVTLESTAGSVTANKKAMIAVKGNADSDKTEVNVGKDVTVTSTKGAGLIIYSDASDDNGYKTGESTGVVVNVAGTWTTDLYTVSVHGQVEEADDSNPVINVSEGKFTSNSTIAFYASGYGEWNIKGGEIIGKDAFKYRTGKVVIEGDAKLTGTGKADKPAETSGGNAVGAAFNFSKDNRSPITDSATTNVKLNGGTFKSESGYAIYFEDLKRVKGEDAVIEINSGSYTSKGNKPAIGFATDAADDADDFLKNHESMIKGGEFTNKVVDTLASYPAEAIAQTLTKGIELKTENGKVVVGNGNVNINDNTPGDQGNTGDDANTPGTTNPSDTNVPDVPKTNDNILVYAGLGLVSALTVGFTTRRKENN